MFIRIVDLETTGFTPPEHAPCEIGWCDLGSRDEGATWKVVEDSFASILCNPSRPIPPETSAIHHIIDADVKGSIFWPAALDTACNGGAAMFAPKAYAAHNAKFEKQWLTGERTGGAAWICTYKCALRLWPDAPGHSNQCLRYWRNPEGLSREVANVAHRAFPDAYVTAFLLRDMLQEAKFEHLVQWSSEPALLAKVPFGQSRGMRWAEVDSGFIRWVLDRDFDADVMFTAEHERQRRIELARAERAAAAAPAASDDGELPF